MDESTTNILFIELQDKTSALHLLPVLRLLVRRNDYRCVVLGQTNTYLVREARKMNIPTYDISYVEFNVHKPHTFINVFRTLRVIANIIRTHKIRIIHCHRLNWAYLGILASWIFRTRLFVDIVYLEKLTSSAQLLLLRLYKKITFLAISKFAKNEFLRYYPHVSSSRVHIFCSGIMFPVTPDKKKAKKLLKDWYGEKIIAMVSRLAPSKGVDVFIEAAGILHNKWKHIKFIFIGYQKDKVWGEHYYRNCRLRIRNLGLRSHFRIAEFSHDVNAVYPHIYFSVLPTHLESLGYVAIESLSYHKPVIITRVGGAPETVNFGKAGMLVPYPASPVLLASRMDTLLNNKKIYTHYAQSGYSWVLKKYNAVTNIHVLLGYYQNSLHR